MRTYNFDNMTVGVDFKKGCVSSIVIGGLERLSGKTSLFRIGVRDRSGLLTVVDAFGAREVSETPLGAVYKRFDGICSDLSVTVSLENRSGQANWKISADPGNSDIFIEWAEFALAAFPKLAENNTEGNGGTVLFPYNEGVLVSDYEARDRTSFYHWPLVYPSYGSLAMFPNMVSSQMLAYLFSDAGIYFGAHDRDRSLKGIDYFATEAGIELRFRLYSGKDFGETFAPDYPVVWAACGPDWESAAAIYRDFFEANLPPRARKISKNRDLPEWYSDSPLVVSYPVRGIHDMDKMDPNAFFPYVEALPVLDYISEKTSARLLVLLMHWEGTAPWAPPYVWPPYGGEKPFYEFLAELRKRNMLIGVYCSGFGYTIKSNVVDDYDRSREFTERDLIKSMCAGPDGKVLPSNICPGQRSGYDICPATEQGKEVLSEAYSPLFESGVDYAQILDQNHGGGQYLCYSRDHGHPPAPGPWMTKNMQYLLSSWNEKAGKMILGCESAAAEPFIGNLLLSDNRYELNYFIGRPVPFYAFVYHEYVRNFMGNQVSCPLEESDETFNYRLGYSFAAGDCMTLVLTPSGGIMSNWGMRDFSHLPNRETVLSFAANLTAFYRGGASKYLFNGRMIPLPDVKCANVSFHCRYVERTAILPEVICTAWEASDGEKALIAVNPSGTDRFIELSGSKERIPALGARLFAL